MLAAVRSATDPLSVSAANTQPFRFRELLFAHNGFIERFDSTLRRPMRERLSDSAYDCVTGTTDSEHLFALLVENRLRESAPGALARAVRAAVKEARALSDLHARRGLFTVLAADGTDLVAARAAVGDEAPTLYYRVDGAACIASEPLDDRPGWTLLGSGSMLVARRDGHRVEEL
jgi:glutamine amidotransferase